MRFLPWFPSSSGGSGGIAAGDVPPIVEAVLGQRLDDKAEAADVAKLVSDVSTLLATPAAQLPAGLTVMTRREVTSTTSPRPVRSSLTKLGSNRTYSSCVTNG